MFNSLRSRMAVSYAALMVGCVGALTIYLAFIGQETYFDTLQQGIEAQARLASVAVEPYLAGAWRMEQINGLARKMAAQSGARVTIIDPNGVVLGDSESDPATMENHASRPEVAAALRGVEGRSERRSATVGYDTLYVAMPIQDGGKVLGVARIALPLDRMNRASQGIALAIVLGGLAAIALAVGLATLIARSIARPINDLTVVAGLVAGGDLTQRARSSSRSEVGRLAEAFDLMAERLESTVKTISAERNTLAGILSTMADGLLIVDGLGRVTMANRAASALLRVPESALEGRSYVEALRDHELSSVVQRCLSERAPSSGTSEVGPGRRLLRIVAAPLVGETRGALALLQDLTEVRRVEMVRRDFIANVSHELRTPLASLKAVVETLEEGAIEDHEAARDFLAKMHGEVDGLAQLVSELLELSRIESGQASLRIEPTAVDGLVRQSVERLLAQAERAGLAIGVDLPLEIPAVAADSQRVQQLLLNLIHNAIKFTPAGGRIPVAARPDGDDVVFTVSDTGVGIPEEDLTRIFERFYKTDRSRSAGGTGLGLAIAKHIA
ncbi:MAG TPA: ATP-binding protein, partial [Chloroflexota bacterium]